MKKAFIILAAVILGLSLLSACTGAKTEVTQGSTPLTAAPAPTESAPTAPASQQAPATTIATGNQEGNLAPDFQLNDLDGKPVALSDFRGKVVPLNFWATW